VTGYQEFTEDIGNLIANRFWAKQELFGDDCSDHPLSQQFQNVPFRSASSEKGGATAGFMPHAKRPSLNAILPGPNVTSVWKQLVGRGP